MGILCNECGVQRFECFGHGRLIDDGVGFVALPLNELNETVTGVKRAKDPGVAARSASVMAHGPPETRILFDAVERNTSSCDEQVALQRISQMMPIAIVPKPVN